MPPSASLRPRHLRKRSFRRLLRNRGRSSRRRGLHDQVWTTTSAPGRPGSSRRPAPGPRQVGAAPTARSRPTAASSPSSPARPTCPAAMESKATRTCAIAPPPDDPDQQDRTATPRSARCTASRSPRTGASRSSIRTMPTCPAATARPATSTSEIGAAAAHPLDRTSRGRRQTKQRTHPPSPANGRSVGFESTATNLGASPPNEQAFLRRCGPGRQSSSAATTRGQTARATPPRPSIRNGSGWPSSRPRQPPRQQRPPRSTSANSGGGTPESSAAPSRRSGDGYSNYPSISANGRWASFYGASPSLGGNPAFTDVFRSGPLPSADRERWPSCRASHRRCGHGSRSWRERGTRSGRTEHDHLRDRRADCPHHAEPARARQRHHHRLPRELAACVERANLDPAVHVIALAGTAGASAAATTWSPRRRANGGGLGEAAPRARRSTRGDRRKPRPGGNWDPVPTTR